MIDAGELKINADHEFAVGLGGFAYSELFGVPNPSFVADFQCREACVAVRDDTSYCGGPYACNTRVCSASFAQDGEDEYRLPKACPVAIDDADDHNTIMSKRQVSCYTCDNCGDVPDADFADLQDWGRGCANECSRLRCGVGEIFDFTDNTCKTCAQLRDIRLCPSSTQTALRTTDVSGNGVLLQREDCREKPGQFDLSRFDYYDTDVASPDPQYGNCEVCPGQSCEDHQYADTCDTCTACIRHDFRLKEKRTWTQLNGTNQELFCQLPQCPGDRTGVHSDGSLCIDTCTPEVELACTSSEFVMPCQLPHNTRCRPRWPAPMIVDAAGEAEDVLVAKTVTSSAVDMLGDALDTTSFENALVEIEEQSMHRHVCVWNAMDIRDSVARPGGISRTWLKPADSIDKVYGKTGTKFCPPIGSFGSNDDVDYIAWARDATVQDYPLLPLQNTVTESTGSKSKYMLTNTSASVMHYVDVMGNDKIDNSIYYDSVQLPARPASFVGDLFLALDLKSAVRGDVAYQITLTAQSSSLLFTAWVRVLAMQNSTRALAEPVAVDVGVDLIGISEATVTQRAWLDMGLVESYSAVLPAAATPSTVTVTLQAAVVQAINQQLQLHELTSLTTTESKKDMLFSNAASLGGFSSIVTDGSLQTNSNSVRTTMRHSFQTMHGSFVQARHATTCDLLIATEREIYCNNDDATLFEAPEQSFIVDFVVVKDADGEEAGVVITVEKKLDQRVHMLSLFAVSTGAQNADTKITSIDSDPGAPITVAAQGDKIMVVSQSNSLNEIKIDTYSVGGLLHGVSTPKTLKAQLQRLRDLSDEPLRVTLSSLSSSVSVDAAQLDLRIRSAALLGHTNGVIAIGLVNGLMLADLHGNTVTVAVDTDTTDPVCKPSLEWLDSSATEDSEEQRFIVGVPCQGLLWRGRSSATEIQLRPIVKTNNMLRAAHFFRVDSHSGTQWWRFGVFTAADLSVQTTASACADGYGSELNEVLPYTASLIEDSWSCSWLCTQDPTCKAYNDNGACYHYSGSTGDGMASIHCPKKSEPAKTIQLVQSEQRFMTTVRSFQVLKTVENFRQGAASDELEHATAMLYLPPAYNVSDFNVLEIEPATLADVVVACKPVVSFTANDVRFATIDAGMQAMVASTSTTLTFPEFNDNSGVLRDYEIDFTFAELPVDERVFMLLETSEIVAQIKIYDESKLSGYDANLDANTNTLLTMTYKGTYCQSDLSWTDQQGYECFNYDSYEFENCETAVSSDGVLAKTACCPCGGGEENPRWELQRVGTPFDVNYLLQGNKLRMPSDVTLRAFFTHPTVDVSLPEYSAGFTPTPNTPTPFTQKSSQWRRVSALVSAAQASQISRVQLHATRREDVTNGDWAAEDCDTQLVVGVDALSMLPLVSEVPAYRYAADKLVVGIRVPDPLPGEFSEVRRGNDADSWERLHVRALVLGDSHEQCQTEVTEVRVRQRMSYPIFDDGSYTLNSNLHSLGCTIHPGLDECFFELPLKLAHASVLAVEFAFSDANCAPALDQLFVTLAPPHSTQYECPLLVQYWNAEDKACEGCAGTSTPCIAGRYRPGCEALAIETMLDEASECTDCDQAEFEVPSVPSGLTFDAVYAWSNAGTCMVDCNAGYTKNTDGNCVPCAIVDCGVGVETITCTTDVDTYCKPCEIPFEHNVFTVNEKFTTANSCETECNAGHYRASFPCASGETTGLCEYSPCVPCSTLDEVRAVLSLTARPAGEFYEFVPCTGTSDLFHSPCSVIAVDGVDYPPTADASDVGTPCMYECPAGHYYHQSVDTHPITITSDQQPLQTQLDISRAGEVLTDSYMDMQTAYCTQCTPLQWQIDNPGSFEALPQTVDVQCPFECTDGYDLWQEKCQVCPDNCDPDKYPGGDVDCSCQLCDTTQFPKTDWTWSEAGTLGDNTSCQGACDSGYFRNGAHCLEKSTEPTEGCDSGYWWDNGSELFDASCLPCQSCEGQEQTAACSADSDATCTPCTNSIDVNSERFVGIICTIECLDGFIRDRQASGSNDCENCNSFECAPGSKLSPNPTHCKDCTACATNKPQFAHWVYQCEYACNVGYVLKTVTTVQEDGSETQQDKCVVEKSGLFMAHANVAERKNVRCTGAEFLGPDYTCQPCTVSTPPLSQLNSTWNWLLKSCQWECKADRLLYSDIVNAKHCLTWQAFQDTAVARQNTFNVRFSVIQHVVPRLSMHEILCCMLVLTVCVSLQVWF